MSEEKAKLPKGWQWVRLSNVAEVVNGFGFPSYLQGHTDLPYPYIKVSDMNAEGAEITVNSAANTVDDEILATIGAKIYPANTVIFPKVGGALLTNKKRILGVEATFDNNVMGVVPKVVQPKWLYYWFLTFDLRSLANTQALPSIRQSSIEALSFPLPPLDEQKRIVAVLDEKLAAVERARTAAQAQLDAAQALPAAYLRAVFESQEARGWPKKRLGEILSLRREIIYPKDQPYGPATFVGLEHTESGTGVRTGSVDVEMSQLTGRKPKFYRGDLVYGYLRPYLNKVWIAEFDGLCSVDQYVYLVNADIALTEFIAWFMRSSTYLQRAPIDTTPGQLPRIRTEEVATVEINLPPLEKQQTLIQALQDHIKASKQAIKSLSEQLDAINRLPGSLLRQAFRGEL